VGKPARDLGRQGSVDGTHWYWEYAHAVLIARADANVHSCARALRN
jgi:hypothetical protein